MSRDLLAAWRAGAPDRIRWIVKTNQEIPVWAREGEVPTAEVPFRTPDAEAQILAVRLGLGMATLSCFVGDADPLLVRVPATPLLSHGQPNQRIAPIDGRYRTTRAISEPADA